VSTPPDELDPLAAAAEEELRRIGSITDATLAHLGLDELLDELLRRVSEILDADTAAILLLDESTNELVSTAAKGLEDAVRQGVRVPLGRGFAGRIAAERRPVILDRVDDSTVVNPVLRTAGIQSLVGAPLMVEGKPIGVIHVGTLSVRQFTDKDAELLQMVADRAALALSVRIAQFERETTARLQRSLLPERLPVLDGLECAARYVPGGANQLGGDWYDVFVLPSGLVAVAIGDVVGKGIGAAVVMGRFRNALRAYALEVDDPAVVLSRLDHMIEHFEPDAMATVLFGVFTHGMDTLRISSAGHPAPCLAQPGEESHVINLKADPPIGTGVRASRHVTTVPVPVGATLYLYTDGVVERRGLDIEIGIKRLCAAAEAGNPETGCMLITTRLLEGGEPEDDWAVLGLHRLPVESS
jgi:serine phosphatase RsbU (regulator of sigma subunit)